MRSYGEYCSVAKALDLVGDRWSLLIVRELLILGGRRFGELQDGLPGIATNLLTERLRHLGEAGVLGRDEAGRYTLWPGGGRR
jgi:DNA-binding HxlR family transcriptional regulator